MLLKENALMDILESPEPSEYHEETPTLSGEDMDDKTEEVPLEEQDRNAEEAFDFSEYGFEDPFFTKLLSKGEEKGICIEIEL